MIPGPGSGFAIDAQSGDGMREAEHDPDTHADAFLARWRDPAGSERANTQVFVTELCELLGVERPAPAGEGNARVATVFEYGVAFRHPDGSTTKGFIDAYKRDCFILEAKQSGKRAPAPDAPGDLLGDAAPTTTTKTAARGWDTVMRRARHQSEAYARALPVDHGYPPFLLIVDVGRVIEVYADFSGLGKHYAHFPDKRRHRIALDDLRYPHVRERLASIWTDPFALNPARHAAEVTRDIADRLARVAARLEGTADPHLVARFLMRCLFTMFAEDVGLLPGASFTELLARQKDTPETFPHALEHFWASMDRGGYDPIANAVLWRFNGELFKDRTALPLDRDGIAELHAAALRDWSNVEPAIFGTLLERALDPRERARLGAHYTPRAYVERLVAPTILEPLRTDWQRVQAHVAELDDAEAARRALRDFLHQLATTRVLDPACGTGNFLYVAMEQMKHLEGEVLAALEELGEDAPRLALAGETVEPSQFLGLEVNPRAVPIADLVLWIGYLTWQLKTGGRQALTEPLLHAHGTIREQDAVITWTARELRRDERGEPITVWDGRTHTDHPVTGDPVPDDSARVETYRYTGPKPASWPEADFIVGNPPFIAGKDLRAELGDGYAEAVWAARPHMPKAADFVMHFWDAAAEKLTAKGSRPRRFGFITTNSLTQTFSRRVLERHLNAKTPVSLVFAVPDHPWLKRADKAAVRIAMTVAEPGERTGTLARVTEERGLTTDTPRVALEHRTGKVLANLTIGADVSGATALWANEALASRGVSLHGPGFIVSPERAHALGLDSVPGLNRHIRPYRNGRDISQRPRGVMVIDLYPLSAETVRNDFPAVYQHVADHVKPERDQNRRKSYRDNWWIFGEPRSEFREFVSGISRYITTIETAKHRFFQFLDADVCPDNKLLNLGISDAESLSILSSRVHTNWFRANSGKIGVYALDSVYVKTRCFDPFPFPAFDTRDAATRERLRELGEELDAHRKARLEGDSRLTMTGLYNVLEKVRAREADADAPALTAAEREIYDAGLVGVLRELHDEIDRLTLTAYGWADLIPSLVGRPGATAPSPHVDADQEAAEQDLLERLVQLNRERAAEEARGHIRWLRPEFQKPKLAHKVPQPAEGETLAADVTPATRTAARQWPKDAMAQIRAVHEVLAAADTTLSPDAVARAFSRSPGRNQRRRVAEVLDTLVATGAATTPPGDPESVFVPR